MTLEQLVPTLEVCQSLRKAGFPQDTAFSWYPVTPAEEVIDDSTGTVYGREPMKGDPTEFVFMSGECNDALCAAPTAGELEEWLRTKYPDATLSSFRRGDFGMDADIDDDTLNYHNGVGMYSTLVAALAALVLEVVE